MKPRIALKSTLKSIALGLALILTTLCYGQANYQGAPHNVIYSNGYDTYGNDAFPEIANSDYTDVIVNFITVDASVNSNCQFTSQPYISPSDMQTLHNAGKTVLVSFGGADNVNQNTGEDYTSEAYQACSGNVDNLASQIANFVYANGFNGVDIDFEDYSAFNAGGAYDGVVFLTELTDDLYYQLSQAPFFEQNIITHAPQTAYWLDDYNYPYPPYAQIFWNSGSEIAWFNNQTYNNCLNGGNTDCTATDKINNYANIVDSVQIPSIKLVMGVPVSYCGTTAGDPPMCTGDGYIPWSSQDGNDMGTVISQLQNTFPDSFGGIMGWDFTLDSNQPNQWGYTWNYEMEISMNYYQQPWVGWNALTGLVLDSDYNGNLYTDSYSGAISQEWLFDGNTIADRQTHRLLDSNAAGAVYTDFANGGNYQNWQFFGNTIVDRQTGRCLDSDYNGNVSTNPCNGGDSQNWNVPGRHP
jgi:chitinase